MGAFYNSICIPGDEHRRIGESLRRWLGGRGFEISDQPVLFDLDGETERRAFVVWSSDWTLLFFSRYEEERRLIRELQTWSRSVLYIWVHDSDVWGYDVFDRDSFISSFNSDPNTFRSFADNADADSRPAADARILSRRLGVDLGSRELQAILRRRAIFKEDVCHDFCRLIGAEPALTSYDDLERGTFEADEDWRVQSMLFVHRDAVVDNRRLVDLHSVPLGGRGEHGRSAEISPQIEIPHEVLAELERRRKRTWLMLFLLRPLSWLARTWRAIYSALGRQRHRAGHDTAGYQAAGHQAAGHQAAGRHTAGHQAGPRRHDSSAIIEVRHLINERHRCRIRLPVGGKARPGSLKPASVFAFQIGPTSVTCTARRRSLIEEALQRPSRSKVLRDEKYLVGDLRARHIVFQLPPYYLAGASGPSFLGLHVVQTDWALYIFLYRFPKEILKEVELAIRATVESFRLTS